MEYGALIQLIGAAMANGQDQQAMQLRQQAAAQFNIPLPQLDQMVAEQLPPDSAARYSQATTATKGEDAALEALQQEISAGGETPQDKAAYVRAGVQAGGITNSLESAALRNLASRGLAGSGLETASMNQAAQQGSQRAFELSTQEASDAANRRLGAISQEGSLASGMRGQELSALEAQDAINKFNASSRTQADMYNLGLPQQNFGNQMGLAGAKANAMNGLATAYNDQAGRTATQAAGLGTAANAAARNNQTGASSMPAPQGPVPSYSDTSGSIYGNPDEWEKWSGA